MIKKYINTEGDVVLYRGPNHTKPVTCPYTTPVLVPSQLAGGLGMEVRPCGSHCPLFENLHTSAVLHCNRSQGEGFTIETGPTVTPKSFPGTVLM